MNHAPGKVEDQPKKFIRKICEMEGRVKVPTFILNYANNVLASIKVDEAEVFKQQSSDTQNTTASDVEESTSSTQSSFESDCVTESKYFKFEFPLRIDTFQKVRQDLADHSFYLEPFPNQTIWLKWMTFREFKRIYVNFR